MTSDAGQRIQRSFGGGHHERRDPHDFWPTPMACTVALMRFLAEHEPWALQLAREAGIREPACGDGAMARVLEAMGFAVDASDLVDRGHGRVGEDFLTADHRPPRVLITNPPFGYQGRLAEAFIARARTVPRLSLAALLLPTAFWNARRRLAVFAAWKPAWFLHLTWRPDFTGGGSGTMQLDWVVWTVWSWASHSAGQARTELLPEPVFTEGGGLWG